MATTWNIDPAHTDVSFKIKHLMVSNVKGTFGAFEGNAVTDGDSFENAKFNFSADINSIDTKNSDRDNHLRSGEFFDSEKFPKMTFESTSFEKNGDDFQLTGNLTIKGKTNPVVLDAEFGGEAKDPWGNAKAGFTISGKVNRKDYDLVWNAPLETGGMLLGDDVKINIELQLVKS